MFFDSKRISMLCLQLQPKGRRRVREILWMPQPENYLDFIKLFKELKSVKTLKRDECFCRALKKFKTVCLSQQNAN